ncbi:hypothetical protein WR25_17456 [Diploscapter pachys]|uniref:Uncharacterized protein n=1 Tax=Diploscapter pachys TaxID=2018661 RepID=A0A2A2M2H2_9BILA|nr:hypothetical protein WR25_17456 [Diploscapter pachys]
MHAKHWNGGNLRFLVLVKRETHRKLVHLADRRQLWPGRPAQVARTGETEAPWRVDRAGNADAGAGVQGRCAGGGDQREGWRIDRGVIEPRIYAERLAQPPRAGAEQARIGEAAARDHRIETVRGFERADQHRAAGRTHDVEAPVDTVAAVDIGAARRPEHRGIAWRRPARTVRGGIVGIIGLRLDNRAADAIDQQGRADKRPCDLFDVAIEGDGGRRHGAGLALSRPWRASAPDRRCRR